MLDMNEALQDLGYPDVWDLTGSNIFDQRLLKNSQNSEQRAWKRRSTLFRKKECARLKNSLRRTDAKLKSERVRLEWCSHCSRFHDIKEHL